MACAPWRPSSAALALVRALAKRSSHAPGFTGGEITSDERSQWRPGSEGASIAGAGAVAARSKAARHGAGPGGRALPLARARAKRGLQLQGRTCGGGQWVVGSGGFGRLSPLGGVRRWMVWG